MNNGGWRRSLAIFAAMTIGLVLIALGAEIAAKLAGSAWQ